MSNFTLATTALAVVALISITGGFIGGRRTSDRNYAGPVQDFLLANRGLESRSVVMLLLSTSFSLNGMLYQIWLGYIIGVWALGIQAVWALGYVWLSRYVRPIRSTSGLHVFLESRFGRRTRMLAALCSLAGFTILVGWEFSVGRSTFQTLLDPGGSHAEQLLTYFTLATVLVSVIYTVMGGLGGDALADTIQNILKGLVFCLMAVALYLVAYDAHDLHKAYDLLTPNFSTIVAQLGKFGLITNIAFSAVWQFVDMSTWQGIVATKGDVENRTAISALRRSGIAVFLAPGVIGTILGALLTSAKSATSDNIMAKVIEVLPVANPFVVFVVFIVVLATIMSMVDGALLAAAYALVCDVLFTRFRLDEIDKDERLSNLVLSLLRVSLFMVAIGGGLGVQNMVDHGIPLFAITYVLVIAQLALVGPVMVGLASDRVAGDRMAFAIVAGLVVGFGSLAGSFLFPQMDWLLTGAGFFSSIASIGVATVLSSKQL